MSAPRVQRMAHLGKGAQVRQLASHAHLLNDVSKLPAPVSDRSRRGRLDALIVPTPRPASVLAGLIEVAARLHITIVALCSQQANFTQVAERIERTAGARGVTVSIDKDYALPHGLTSLTSSNAFLLANGERTSDLSVKRNAGLLLARLLGWRKIAFIDDDVTLTTTDLGRLADHLDRHQIAGMMCRDFPDNSVLCHA